MASPKIALDIRNYLVNTILIDDVSVGFLSPTPVNQYAVVEYPGPANIKVHGTGLAGLDEANIQIQCRHTNAQTALTRIMEIVDALDGLQETTINGTVYTYFTEISRPRILTRQDDGAVIFIWECRVQARR